MIPGRPVKTIAVLLGTVLAALRLPAAPTLQQNYLGVYLEIRDAQARETQQDDMGALVRYQVAEAYLGKMQALFPQWETALVSHRLLDCKMKIEALRPLAAQQVAGLNDEWTLDAPAMGRQGGLADVERAQAKLTFLQVMRANHPELGKAGFDDRIRHARKAVDDLVNVAVKGQKALANGSAVQ